MQAAVRFLSARIQTFRETDCKAVRWDFVRLVCNGFNTKAEGRKERFRMTLCGAALIFMLSWRHRLEADTARLRFSRGDNITCRVFSQR